MKKSIVIVIFACILSNICVGVFFSNKSYKSLTVHPVKVLLDYSQTAISCILEVYPNGILEVTTGRSICGVKSLNNREYFDDNTKRKWKKLSKKECSIIDALIGRILVECDEEYVGGYVDMGMVYMVIDDKDYMSLYSEIDSHIRMENKAVSELAHELVKMSPIKLTGWEHYINK